MMQINPARCGWRENPRMTMRAGALLVAALAWAAASPCARADSWQLGAGVSRASVSSSYSAIASQSAGGWAVTGAWEFAETWWLEGFGDAGHKIATGETQDIYYPPDRAEFGIFAIGVRKDLWPLFDRGWTPWVTAGFGIGQVYWDTYFYELTGSGFALAGGFDVRLGETPFVLRGQLLRHEFSASDTYGHGPYDVTSVLASALLMWRFGADEEDDY